MGFGLQVVDSIETETEDHAAGLCHCSGCLGARPPLARPPNVLPELSFVVTLPAWEQGLHAADDALLRGLDA